MTKSRTVLMVILSLVLAALIVVAGVLGYTLARSAYSDTSETYAGEARWFITSGGVSSFEAEVNVLEKLRPDCTGYEVHVNGGSTGTWWTLLPDDDPGVPKTYAEAEDDDGSSTTSTGPRTREFFGVVATLENAGEVAATVTVTDAEGATRKDGCLGGDDDRYTDEEILEHLSFEVYCSDVGTAAMEDIGAETTEKTVKRADGGDGVSFDLAVGGKIYFYLLVTWATDLDEDMFVTDSDGNKTLNAAYDGTQGDDFDTWAGEHLTGITLSVRARAEQAE